MNHGVTLHAGNAVQEVEIKATQQLSKVGGMVEGKTQTVAAYGHTDETTGTVRGKGDITIAPGFGSASIVTSSVSATGLISDGGLMHIGEVSVKEALGTEAEWSYAFTYMPYAA